MKSINQFIRYPKSSLGSAFSPPSLRLLSVLTLRRPTILSHKFPKMIVTALIIISAHPPSSPQLSEFWHRSRIVRIRACFNSSYCSFVSFIRYSTWLDLPFF
ncbi:uncharacterized protein LOC109839345 [Asparagus officinalis]|uniref:uncharacterized protein LOC109839345 n=1 Tax=Asparagus officinalis TaxID=4686 RepID=UPI00098E605D|nr:uncharacterized protein LOC109839345 [Asparagus officinalis]